MAILDLIKTKVKNRKTMLKKCQICVKFGTFKKKFAKNAKKKKKISTFPVIKSSRGSKFFPLRKIGGFDEKTSKNFNFCFSTFYDNEKSICGGENRPRGLYPGLC